MEGCCLMSDPAQKFDAGKARFDLIPWNEFQPYAVDYPVAAVAESLAVWWSGRPYPLEMSIPTRQLPGVARVLAFGAAKYAPRGWEKGIPFSRIFAAAQRHAAHVAAGELVDAESGQAHESHFWCNVLFLVVFTARGRTDLDDRPDPVPAVVERLKAVQSMLDGWVEMPPPAKPEEGAN